MRDFVDRHSIVRTIWGNPDLVLLIFAGSAAEFALNRAVDWLFFTGKIPGDPIGRLFSTVRYAQEIVFVDEQTALGTLNRINAAHAAVEHERGQTIPDWAYRDVLYMLIDYSERAHQLLYKKLTATQKADLYKVFMRIGEELKIPELPATYVEWQADRQRHLVRDLTYSEHSRLLFKQYQRHLGFWRYDLLLRVQALLVPEEVRRLLNLSPDILLPSVIPVYGLVERLSLQSLMHSVLIPRQYWAQVRGLERTTEAQ
jgi:hypothetical protein